MPEHERTASMPHILSNGEPVEQGEVFEPMPGYSVIFVRMETDRLILRDGDGEFSRPIRPTNKPRPAGPVKLGERRTVLEEIPDARPIVDETIYVMTHQMCVPGGWQTLASSRLRGPKNHAGIYGPTGQMLEDSGMRRCARQLFEMTSAEVKTHPYTVLDELVTKVQLQEGTEGEPGSWDDPGVVMEMAQLLRDSNTI
jgi:hypothetical protein